jgi:hypothetical protein
LLSRLLEPALPLCNVDLQPTNDIANLGLGHNLPLDSIRIIDV